MTKKNNKIPGSHTRWGDGQSIGFPGCRIKVLLTKLSMLFESKPVLASMDDCENIEDVLRYSKRHYSGDDFVIIGHPKTITPHVINLLEYFINKHPEIEFKLF